MDGRGRRLCRGDRFSPVRDVRYKSLLRAWEGGKGRNDGPPLESRGVVIPFFLTRRPLPWRPSRLLLGCVAALLGAGASPSSMGQDRLVEQATANGFASEVAERHGLPRAEIERALGEARVRQEILDLIASPAERKPWHEYRAIFLNDDRIQEGVRFWRANEALLRAAAERFGVPPAIVVAIVGVETRYGRFTGRYRVLDALATLAFAYPRRSAFFRSELEQFFVLAHEESLDPLQPKGSYAGAMGVPQFIASSYRRYAVDFDGDGQRDLWESNADIIGSVANYFARHDWRQGEPVAAPARIEGTRSRALLSNALKPTRTLGELRRNGVTVEPAWPDDQPASLLELDGGDGAEHWVGLHNFYVITRYNHSHLYAMAIYQLSSEILARHDSPDRLVLRSP